MTLQDFFNELIVIATRDNKEASDLLNKDVVNNAKWAFEPLFRSSYKLQQATNWLNAVGKHVYTKEEIIEELESTLMNSYVVRESSTNEISNVTSTWCYKDTLDLRNKLKKAIIE